MHLRDDVLPVDLDHRVFRRTQRDVQHRPVLADVDPVAPEHRVDPLAQAGAFGDRDEQPDGLVGEAVLRIVEVDARGLHGHTRAALGIVGEQVAEVDVAHRLVVLDERPPFGGLGDRAHGAETRTGQSP